MKNFVLRNLPLGTVPQEDADWLVDQLIPHLCTVENPRIARQLVTCLEPMLQLPRACGGLFDQVMDRLQVHWAAGEEVQVVSMVRCLKLAFKASLRVNRHEADGQAVAGILEPRLQTGMITAFELLEMCNEAHFHQVRKLLSGIIMFGVHGCELQELVSQPGRLAQWLRALLDVCEEPVDPGLREDAQQCLWKSKRRCCDSLRTLLNLDKESLAVDDASVAMAQSTLQDAFGEKAHSHWWSTFTLSVCSGWNLGRSLVSALLTRLC